MPTAADIAARIASGLPKVPENGTRRLVAIVGPPGAGKSTVAEALVGTLGAATALVPMDGFHLDNRVLDARGLRKRKGAPETFDAAGFVLAMERLRSGEPVILPAFDRTRDLAIAGAIDIAAEVRTLVVEGNYLLMEEAPWSRLAALWSTSVFLDVPRATLRTRLIDRWLTHGLDPDAALARAEQNDLPNAAVVEKTRTRAGQVISLG
ncbi:MAG: AAA family ATPase [Pseudomonadota bacterium]